MANLPDPAILTADGTYDLPGLLPGREYLLTLKGDFGGGQVSLEVWNDASAQFTSVDGGIWHAATATEARYIAPSHSARLVLASSYSPSLAVTHLPLG